MNDFEFACRYRSPGYVVCKLCGHHIYGGDTQGIHYGGTICRGCIKTLDYHEYEEEEDNELELE